MKTTSSRFLTKRIDDLKQSVILNDAENIDFNNYPDLYVKIINDFYDGKLDDIYSSPFLSKLNPKEKANVLSIARKYFDLCFPYGDLNNWYSHVDSYFENDLDFFLMKIFSDFDILVEVAKYGGESSLKFMRDLGTFDLYSDVSSIDYLKSKIFDIDTMKQVLIELGSDDNFYSKFPLKCKAALIDYGSGNLFKTMNDGTCSVISPVSFGVKYSNSLDSDIDYDNFDYDKFLSDITDFDSFLEIVVDNYLNSCFNSINFGNNIEK